MKPNATELVILKILWRQAPRTGKEIHAEIESKLNWSYSSTRKTLERMCEKGYLAEQKQGNKKIYTATLAKVPTLALYAQEFAKQVMELDAPLPVAMFSDSNLIEADELDELEAMLNSLANNDKRDPE
ncbi:BlaI/MecI/CopY family transcriptional regulator [Pseudoalteromonas sp. McH1-7]|uniref:BlaI/MecI/CopY family transcriptional regulator n=1 Tax=Pseudoalteromonas TaxID=53246 RepID=UPI000F650575|nr:MULTISPECIES: BlaI/MecI/CopY family transcriptional regulator [Pseudoalteromonas]NUZ12684.1 BlaI/MecI/CopY family transcriptional regulator [Pseudoalteromonas sp. McH1-7]MDW7550669.1 BlaI/MecI/CopY family transcriptional regulator [Pseudoalteromonas peptidolytica]RRS06849.1 BlaI/MecI/CopY family transcriptional regulator [Pseudoalteromonas sp. J010]RXF05365.1 BlaI/MecI/CopY family transcriptional regulator [Pseudoalteromonas sp. PS5]USD29914.1 BlaI/MecI/CopY family transcriptional regulator